MNKVDLKGLRSGDTVLIRGVVMGEIRSTTTGDRINVSISGYAYGAHTSDIVSVEPRPLAVGDWVKSEFDTAMDGVIHYIEGNEAVVYEGTHGLEVWLLSGLRRA